MPRVFALLLFVMSRCCSCPAERRGTNVARRAGAQYSDPAADPSPRREGHALPDGSAAAPAEAPPEVQAAIFAANKLLDKPYKYGGGHARSRTRATTARAPSPTRCSPPRLIKSPLDSVELHALGPEGKGTWITVYSNPGHAFAVIAGLRLDTSTGGITSRTIARTAERGPRWRVALRNARGFTTRHPLGL